MLLYHNNEKIYKITFINYTDYSQETVKNEESNEYIKIQSPLLVKESDLQYYSKFGGGIRSAELVGYINNTN